MKGPACRQAGFTLLEIMLVVATITVLAAISVPVYSNLQVKNDLDVATNTTLQTLRRAQTLSQAADGDTTWGVKLQSSDITLFKGASYALRDTNFDEVYSLSGAGINRKQVVSTVTWQQNNQRTGSISLTSYLTNWQASPATCNDYALQQSYSTGTCRENTTQCTNHSETYLSGGDSNCVTTFPGDPSHDTCCALP